MQCIEVNWHINLVMKDELNLYGPIPDTREYNNNYKKKKN
jgi:hypothetical protein